MDENAKERAQELATEIRGNLKELIKVFKNAQSQGSDSEGLHLFRHATAQNSVMEMMGGLDDLQGVLAISAEHEALVIKYTGTDFKAQAAAKMAETTKKLAEAEAIDSLADTMVQEINKRPDEDPFADLMNTLNRRRNSQF